MPQGKAFAVPCETIVRWEALARTDDRLEPMHEGDHDAGRVAMRDRRGAVGSTASCRSTGYSKRLAALEAEGGDSEPLVDDRQRDRGVRPHASAISTPRSIASAAKSSSNTTPPTPPPPKPPSSLPSASRKPRKPAASSCALRCRWPSSTSRPAARSTPTPFWRRCCKAFRRRRNFRRLRRRSLCWPPWTPARICDAGALSPRHESRQSRRSAGGSPR